MQLVKLYANMTSFHIVEFNLHGPSLIVAKQKNPESSENGKTYNGVGKSLLVRVLHFCLGGSAKDYKIFCEKLPRWEFCLEFQIKNQNYTAKRNTTNPEVILLNDAELKIKQFTDELETFCFDIPVDSQFLTFRSLLPFFVRPKKESYLDCLKPTTKGTDYQTLLYNSFLIGLDINLAKRKYLLKKDLTRIKDLKANFEKDEVLKDYLIGKKDPELTIDFLHTSIEKIEKSLDSFKIAEDYHDIQQEANDVESRLFDITNELTLIKNNINSIDNSLDLLSTANSTNIEQVYSEAQVIFSESIKKTISDVNNFHNNLIKNRSQRLLEQKNKLLLDCHEKDKEAIDLKEALDGLLEYLGKHQALDMFVSLSQKLADCKKKKENLENYQNLLSVYKAQERQIGKDMIEISEIADKYLKDIEQETVEVKDFFRNLAQAIYPKTVSGLTIKTNEGENQLAFNIEPRIESDSSDGIGNVKLFCYDLSLLFKGKNHNMNFIFHDSRIFNGVDERQKATMLRIVNEYFTENQYIATINQNQMKEIETQLNPVEYKSFIEDNIVLTLTDDSDAEKLLGIKVDL